MMEEMSIKYLMWTKQSSKGLVSYPQAFIVTGKFMKQLYNLGQDVH